MLRKYIYSRYEGKQHVRVFHDYKDYKFSLNDIPNVYSSFFCLYKRYMVHFKKWPSWREAVWDVGVYKKQLATPIFHIIKGILLFGLFRRKAHTENFQHTLSHHATHWQRPLLLIRISDKQRQVPKATNLS